MYRRSDLKRVFKAVVWLVFLLLLIISPAVLTSTYYRDYADWLRRTGDLSTVLEFERRANVDSPIFGAFCMQNWFFVPRPPLPPPPPPPTYVKYMPSIDQFNISGKCSKDGSVNATVTLVVPGEVRIDWGDVAKDQGDFVIDLKIEQLVGKASGTSWLSHTYELGRLNVSVYDPKSAPYDMDRIPYNFTVRAWGSEIGTAPFVVWDSAFGYGVTFYPLRVREPAVYVEYVPDPSKVYVRFYGDLLAKDPKFNITVQVVDSGKYRVDWGNLIVNGTELRVDIKMEWLNGTRKPGWNSLYHVYSAYFISKNQRYNLTVAFCGKEVGTWELYTSNWNCWAERIKSAANP
ncbi:MAG: hypothetical protein ACP5KV_07045 [Candidatus Methanomethylicaceae archaeon]